MRNSVVLLIIVILTSGALVLLKCLKKNEACPPIEVKEFENLTDKEQDKWEKEALDNLRR